MIESTFLNFTKTSKSKECDISHYWYFSNKGFKFQSLICNRCHDLLMVSLNLSDIAFLEIKNAGCHCIISGISRSKAIKLLQNIDLSEKSGTYSQEQFLNLQICCKF